MKRILIILVGLLSVGFAIVKTEGIINPGSRRVPYTADDSSEQTRRGKSSEFGAKMTSAKCMSAEDISNALQKFTSENASEIDQARTLLLGKARESEQCRVDVITALMKAMDRPDLDFRHDNDSYYLWLYGAQLLGDLKATEALDLLISHLGLTAGFFSSSMNHMPALKGVIKMGAVAIPKLDEVMRHNPDPDMRFYAVYCIATIGGPSAISSLRGALDTESDECVRRSIHVSLDSFDNNGNIKDRMKWFFGLSCKQ